MTVDRWDDFSVLTSGNLHDQLVGRTLTFGDPEIRGQEEHTITVTLVQKVSVGMDSTGIFAVIQLEDTDGRAWAFSSYGWICDQEGKLAARGYRLTCLPVAA